MIPVIGNPLATKSTALLWIGGLKLLDIASTLAGQHFVPTRFNEVNVLINALQPHIGFTAAAVLTAPLALILVYVYHDRYPVLSETLVLLLPLAVIGNTLIIVAADLWIYYAGFAATIILGYLAVGTYQHHKQSETWRERLFSCPDPVFWTPVSASNSGDHQ